MKIKTLKQAQKYLYSYRLAGMEQRATALEYNRCKYLARLLGNPQNKIKVIHIAGTSGKGSTSTMVSSLLHGQGKKVGLSISPHLYDFRERVQINNELTDPKIFIKYLNEISPALEKMKTSKYGPATFLEIMIIFAYYIFHKENVDYAVMETATGGRYDPTNVATGKNKISVFTKFGLDHIDILGDTLKKIATEKSAIITKENIVISIYQRPTAQRVIGEYAKKQNTTQNIISLESNYSHRRAYQDKLRFDFSYKGLTFDKITLALEGVYQVENASLALAALFEASKRDGFTLQEDAIRDAFLHIKNPGRFEELEIDKKRIIIDGAHNPQKMSAFIQSLKKKHGGKKMEFIIAFKKGKDFKDMVKYIAPIANRIYATSFDLTDQAEVMESEDPNVIKDVLKEKYSYTKVTVVPGSENALATARSKNKHLLVITGSLYLISELYKKIHAMIDAGRPQISE